MDETDHLMGFMPGDRLRLLEATQKDAEIARLREALTLAEDVLSRSPYSTDFWPNGMHPNRGITIIREALAHPR